MLSEQTYLKWDDINFYVPAKKSDMDGNNIVPDLLTGKMQKQILRNSTGYVKPAELVAIMGPSGSGKTSLLNVIAGRLALTKGSSYSGNISVNGRKLGKDDFGKIAAFV